MRRCWSVSSTLPLFAAIQSLLTSLAQPHDAVETAFALEAVLQEIVFLGGPVLVAVLVAVGSPTLAMAACGALTLVGGLLFSATRAARGTSAPSRPSTIA